TQFHNQLLDRLKNIPGVDSVGTISFVPLSNTGYADFAFNVEGLPFQPGNPPTAYTNWISADYIKTMQIPLIKGRALTAQDNANSQKVVIINQTMARRYFGNEDPLGKRITLNPEKPTDDSMLTIIG